MRACNPGVASVRTASRNLISSSVPVVSVDADVGVNVKSGTATYAGAEGAEAEGVAARGRTEKVEGEGTSGILVGHCDEGKKRPASSPPASESSSEGASDGAGEPRASEPSDGATSLPPRTAAWYLVDVSNTPSYTPFYFNHRDGRDVCRCLSRHCLHVTHMPGSTRL
jgi:hypothetical protein